jgi:hypothetical protein
MKDLKHKVVYEIQRKVGDVTFYTYFKIISYFGADEKYRLNLLKVARCAGKTFIDSVQSEFIVYEDYLSTSHPAYSAPVLADLEQVAAAQREIVAFVKTFN